MPPSACTLMALMEVGANTPSPDVVALARLAGCGPRCRCWCRRRCCSCCAAARRPRWRPRRPRRGPRPLRRAAARCAMARPSSARCCRCTRDLAAAASRYVAPRWKLRCAPPSTVSTGTCAATESPSVSHWHREENICDQFQAKSHLQVNLALRKNRFRGPLPRCWLTAYTT